MSKEYKPIREMISSSFHIQELPGRGLFDTLEVRELETKYLALKKQVESMKCCGKAKRHIIIDNHETPISEYEHTIESMLYEGFYLPTDYDELQTAYTALLKQAENYRNALNLILQESNNDGYWMKSLAMDALTPTTEEGE